MESIARTFGYNFKLNKHAFFYKRINKLKNDQSMLKDNDKIKKKEQENTEKCLVQLK